MANKGLVLLDTSAFDHALEHRDSVLKEYNDINTKFDDIVETLLNNWKGKGADAFKKDSDAVRTNLTGLNDILKTMCDTLADCKEVFAECDKALGEYNSNPQEE